MFVVLEIQMNTDGVVSTLTTSFVDKKQAESKYHTVLAYAAVSTLPIHTAFLLTADGYIIESKCFQHEQDTDE